MKQSKLLELNRRKVRVATKRNMAPSPQELAQLNLIEISNLEYTEAPDAEEKAKKQINCSSAEQSHKPLIRSRKINTNHQQHKSVELKRISVTERWTESFKAGRQTASSFFKTNNNPSFNKKVLPISVSNYLLLGGEKKNTDYIGNNSQGDLNNKNQIILCSRFHPPKPSIASRTYYFRQGANQSSRQKYENDFSDDGDLQRRKIYPRQETYWKIFKI